MSYHREIDPKTHPIFADGFTRAAAVECLKLAVSEASLEYENTPKSEDGIVLRVDIPEHYYMDILKWGRGTWTMLDANPTEFVWDDNPDSRLSKLRPRKLFGNVLFSPSDGDKVVLTITSVMT